MAGPSGHYGSLALIFVLFLVLFPRLVYSTSSSLIMSFMSMGEKNILHGQWDARNLASYFIPRWTVAAYACMHVCMYVPYVRVRVTLPI